MVDKNWIPAVKLMLQSKAKIMFTEIAEPSCEIVNKIIIMNNRTPSIPMELNPFRQPIQGFATDTNFVSFSNGFFVGVF